MRARSISRRSSPASAVGAVALLLIAGCSAGSSSDGAGSGPAVDVVRDSPLTDPRGLHRFGGRVYFENHDTVASLHTFTVVVARADGDGQDDVLRAHVFTDVEGYLYGAPSIQAFAADPRMLTQLFDPHATPKYLSERGKQVAEFGGYQSEPGCLSDDFVLRPIPLAFAVTVVGASPGAVWVIPKLHHRRGPIAFAAKFELDDLRLEGPTAEVGLLSDDVDETVRVELDERTSFRNVGRDSRRLSFGEGRDAVRPTSIHPLPLHRLDIVVAAPEGVSPECFYVAAAASSRIDDARGPRFLQPDVRRCDARGLAEFDLPPGRWRLTCGSLYSEGVVEIDEVTLPAESPGATTTRTVSSERLGARVGRRVAFPGATGPVWGMATIPAQPGLNDDCDILFRADRDPETVATIGRVSTRFWDASLRVWASHESSADSGADGTMVKFGLDRLQVDVGGGRWSETRVRFTPLFADDFSSSTDRSVVRLREMERVPSGRIARSKEHLVRSGNETIELTRGAAYMALAYRLSWSERYQAILAEKLSFSFITAGRGDAEFDVETIPFYR